MAEETKPPLKFKFRSGRENQRAKRDGNPPLFTWHTSFTPPPEVLRGELRGELRILQARHAIAIELLTMAYGVVSLRFPGSVLATTLRDHLDGELSNG